MSRARRVTQGGIGARALALLLLLLPGRAVAGDLHGGGRLQSSLVRDSNVFEAIEAAGRRSAGSIRLLGAVELRASELPLSSRAEVSLRGLTESLQDYPKEDRRQGEASVSWDLASATGRHRLALEAGYGRRAYPNSPSRSGLSSRPDSSSGGHHRTWGRFVGAAPVGPRGSLVGRLDLWQLDFGRTARVDRTGGGFDLSYEHPWGPRLVLRGGLELGTVRHGFPSLRLDRGSDPPTISLGADRLDHDRFLHVGFRRTGRLVLQVQAGLRSQASNSLDGAFRRPEVTWLVSRPLGWRVIGQFYGNLEHTTYTARALRDFYIDRTGEVEAGEDDNTVVLRLTRPVTHGWDLDAQLGWYRNESTLVGVYYRKQVASLGISRSFGSSSGF
jgi:hypothetical protein